METLNEVEKLEITKPQKFIQHLNEVKDKKQPEPLHLNFTLNFTRIFNGEKGRVKGINACELWWQNKRHNGILHLERQEKSKDLAKKNTEIT